MQRSQNSTIHHRFCAYIKDSNVAQSACTSPVKLVSQVPRGYLDDLSSRNNCESQVQSEGEIVTHQPETILVMDRVSVGLNSAGDIEQRASQESQDYK